MDSTTGWKPGSTIPTNTIFCGDALSTLSKLPSASVQTVVTSPPYWSIRDYNHESQIGLETTLPSYLAKLIDVFREVKRVIKDYGVIWLVIADGYTSGNRKSRAPDKKNPARVMSTRPPTPKGLKPKDLLGVPWRLALMLQDDGWYLRNDIIWHKPNAMPESVRDRQMRSHEYVFMLTKSERYFFDQSAIKKIGGQFRRSVWAINTRPFKGAHYATFPPDLVLPCLLSSSRVGDTVLDPFCGSGTTGVVAAQSGRKFVGIDLNCDYVQMADLRLQNEASLRPDITYAS